MITSSALLRVLGASTVTVLVAFTAVGCAAEQATDETSLAGEDDDLDEGSDSEEGEEAVASTADELTTRGCTFNSYIRTEWREDYDSPGYQNVWALGRSNISCTTGRAVEIRTCIQKWKGDRWVAVRCSNCSFRATSTTRACTVSMNLATTGGRGKYRTIGRLVGYGTDVSRAVQVDNTWILL